MQWKNDRKHAKDPNRRLASSLHKRQIGTENKSHKCNDAGDVSQGYKEKYFEPGHFHVNSWRYHFLKPDSNRPEPAK